MKKKSSLKPLATVSCITLTALVGLLTPALTHAAATGFDLANQLVGGFAYLTYDQAAWATLKPESLHTDVHGNVLNGGATTPTADVKGQRYFYPQLFLDTYHDVKLANPGAAADVYIADGTADPVAVAQWRILNPDEQVPAAAPAGGWEMPIDPLLPGIAFGGTGYIPSSFSPYTADSQYYNVLISLGGSLRVTSDFIGPSGSLWFMGMNVALEQGVWHIGSAGDSLSTGAFFELIDPVFGHNQDGLMTLEADYRLMPDFADFLKVPGNTTVLGHLSFNPSAVSAVPVPATVWLMGSALLGLAGLRRRKNIG
ncbi:MAG: VPLPA-CTERM sorting domain-containing protein [Methylococcaceae bacterium]|nr:VPLPA-CTERM sorting domain-containing protein [Methylococcaceae bacterium]